MMTVYIPFFFKRWQEKSQPSQLSLYTIYRTAARRCITSRHVSSILGETRKELARDKRVTSHPTKPKTQPDFGVLNTHGRSWKKLNGFTSCPPSFLSRSGMTTSCLLFSRPANAPVTSQLYIFKGAFAGNRPSGQCA